MHCYRDGTDNWFEFVGVTSRGHGAKYPIEVENLAKDHPIMSQFGDSWTTPQGELYLIKKVWPNVTPLAHAMSKNTKQNELCVWTNEYKKGRVFGTTIGHHNETVQSDEYLDMVTRGFLWSIDKLDEKNFKPSKKKVNAAADNPVDAAKQQVKVNAEKYLKQVKAPDDLDVTLFAAPPQVNYPVCLATTQTPGEVFIGVDPNGSLGKEDGYGHVMRCVDEDGDGVAEKINVFAKMRHPRGLYYENHTLWVLHPPKMTVYYDDDKDGVADRSELLIDGISTPQLVAKRGADHTTNGIRMGIDGWLYIAVGDFGFVKATTKHGQELQFLGGGIARVRPDGTELEIVTRGQRNICDLAVDPQLNFFTRDNTNDGWWVGHAPQPRL